MKRFLLVVAILGILVLARLTWAQMISETSGERTSDAAVFARPCLLTGVLVITNGTNDAKVIMYDNASAATGTVVAEMTVIGASNFGGGTWENPVRMKNGIYVDVTGSGASYVVYYVAQ